MRQLAMISWALGDCAGLVMFFFACRCGASRGHLEPAKGLWHAVPQALLLEWSDWAFLKGACYMPFSGNISCISSLRDHLEAYIN